MRCPDSFRPRVPTAGVLANDPSFDAKQRNAVAALPEVRAAFPFLVAITLDVEPSGFDSRLIPAAASSVQPMAGVIVEGRMPDPARADEVVVDEAARRKLGLDLGATMELGQRVSAADAASAPPGFIPPGVDLNFHARLRVVGITKSVSNDPNWTPSFGFYAKYGPSLIGFVNQLVDLRHGDADLPRFRADVERVVGRPINVESYGELIGLRKAANITRLERNGLLLFALAVLLGGGVLVGQALVRAVTAGAGDIPTWRAIGASRRTVIPALVVPAALSAVTAAASAILIALALSSRFPIGLARLYDVDVGTHADWAVLALGALASVAAVVAIACSRRGGAPPAANRRCGRRRPYRRGPRAPGCRPRCSSDRNSQSSRAAAAARCRCAPRSSAPSRECSASSRASRSAPGSTTRS